MRVRLVAGVLRRDVPRPLVLPHGTRADGAGGRRHRGRDHAARRAAPGPDRRSGLRRRADRDRSRGARPPRHRASTTRRRCWPRRATARRSSAPTSSSSRPTCGSRTSTSPAPTSRSRGSRRSATSTSRPTTWPRSRAPAACSRRAASCCSRRSIATASRRSTPTPRRCGCTRSGRTASCCARSGSTRSAAAAGEHVRHLRADGGAVDRQFSAARLLRHGARGPAAPPPGLRVEAVYGGPGPTPFGVSTRLLRGREARRVTPGAAALDPEPVRPADRRARPVQAALVRHADRDRRSCSPAGSRSAS